MEELASLVQRAQHGDLQAFAAIVERFRDMAFGYAHSRLRDFQLAEDASQEAFVDAYRKLADLREPAAFPGWFRTIVHKHCDRIRRRADDTVPLEETLEGRAAAAREGNEEVLAAVAALPERERAVTTLFYMDGYSQQEVAEFLDVPLTTVKKRLYDARQQLKETLMDTLRSALARHAPDERFSQRVMDSLLNRPRLLEMPGHPVREVWALIRAALPDWTIVEGPEQVARTLYPSVQKAMDRIYDKEAFQPDRGTVLRSHMTHVTFQALAGRKPPVRILAGGRVFRPGVEDSNHLKVFHQADGLCVVPGGDEEAMQRTCEGVIKAVLGATVAIRWGKEDFPFVDNSQCLQACLQGHWQQVLGCGTLKPAMLREAGLDPGAVSGYAFGLGLERLAMLKYGIHDVGELWREPYVKVKPRHGRHSTGKRRT